MNKNNNNQGVDSSFENYYETLSNNG